MVRNSAFLFSAGGESTGSLLGSSAWILADRRDIQQQVRDEPELLAAFIEETLRYEPPFRGHYRHVVTDTTLGGVDLSAGTRLLLLWGAANRDPVQFEAPDEFRLDRPNILQHMAFGRGIHTCPGAPIARAEVRVSLERILDRMADIRLSEAEHGPAGARRLKWDRTFLFRRLKELHLEFTPVE